MGCVLYEIVVGKPPFSSNDDRTDLKKFGKEITTHDIKMKDYFSSKFKDLLCGMLDKDPRSRLTLAQVK